jgi:hypothetical protein
MKGGVYRMLTIKKRNYYFYFEHLLIIFASKNNIYNVTTSQEHP